MMMMMMMMPNALLQLRLMRYDQGDEAARDESAREESCSSQSAYLSRPHCLCPSPWWEPSRRLVPSFCRMSWPEMVKWRNSGIIIVNSGWNHYTAIFIGSSFFYYHCQLSFFADCTLNIGVWAPKCGPMRPLGGAEGTKTPRGLPWLQISAKRSMTPLPSFCTAFSQVFTVNWFWWHTRDERPGVLFAALTHTFLLLKGRKMPEKLLSFSAES